MEISHVLPENERNNFPNPYEATIRVGQHLFMTPVPEDDALSKLGNRLLAMLRKLKSKMTIKTFLAIVQREAEQNLSQSLTAYNSTAGPFAVEYGEFEREVDQCLIMTIKYLANGGFIKLSNAANFEAREIVKYHATAQPKFRSGKFQL